MSEIRINKSLGGLIASVLEGAWRPGPQEWEGSPEDLSRITPLLIASGSGSLAWSRVRNSSASSSPAALRLQEAYRYYCVQSAVNEQKIADVFALLRSAGIDPVLIKGWAIARLYPAKGLRPLGDIDLWIRPDQLASARSVLKNARKGEYFVDLEHASLTRQEIRTFDQVYAGSELVDLRGGKVRIPRPEDHLRILSLHLLKHCAWRTLWLCDIAVALESRPAGFDWDFLMGADRRLAECFACAIGLAHQILGAKVDDTPLALKAKKLPAWLVPSVLAQWDIAAPDHATPPELMLTSLRHPARIKRALRLRWPHPIGATLRAKGPFNELPRLPFQLWDCVVRTGKFVTQLPQSLREQ